jgi:hypothetical protein
MKLIRKLFIAIFTASAGYCRAGNLVNNGSFETNVVTGSYYDYLDPGSAALPGWSIEGFVWVMKQPLLSSLPLAVLDGKQVLGFWSNNSRVSQVINTQPGEAYDVSFALGTLSATNTGQVVVETLSTNGSTLASFTASTPQNVGWGAATRVRFTAADYVTVVRFRGTNIHNDFQSVMDAVSVESVTQPVTIGVADVQICWESKSNRVYQLQYRTTLTTNLWTDLGVPISGTGSNICSVQPVTEPQRFFRVLTLP